MAQARRLLPAPIRLPFAAAAALGDQIRREWRASPPHRALLGWPRPDGLAIRPRDLRPGDPTRGARLLAGEFTLAGDTLQVAPGGDPWRQAAPSRSFAASLHGFAWMPDLLTQGEPGAREALRLWLEWRRVFGQGNAFAWTGLALERRVFNLACAAATLAPLVSEAEGVAYVDSLARQARHLLGDPGDPGRAAERAAAAALVGAGLAGQAGEALLAQALPRLARRLADAVLPDGTHASRAPQRGLDLLFDLLAVDDALSQIGAPAPPDLSRAADRLATGLRFFTLADGRLARFHGGGAAERGHVAAALALDDGEVATPNALAYGGYQRLEGGGLQLILDAGAAPGRAWRGSACAQPGAITLACDGRRLFEASAWSPPAPSALRSLAGGSMLAPEDAWSGAVLREGLLAGRAGEALEGGPAAVKVERRQAGHEVWIDLAHDAWPGCRAERRLYLDTAIGELRGEDLLTPSARAASPRASVRFLLAANVAAQAAVDGRSVLLRSGGGRGWRLRSDAAATLEPAMIFEAGEAKATQALRLDIGGAPGDPLRIRWRLAPDG
jgi:uncharacterized heparinase superfamily protein